ncbi:MAG: hypothetical protein GY856_25945 [bacterium]|nr:hypothetical protein [bacterium]
MMKRKELERILAQTLEDGRLSRGERQALTAIFAELDPAPNERLGYLAPAFHVASEAMTDPRDQHVLEWLEALVRTIFRTDSRSLPEVAEARFAPRQNCAECLRSLLAKACSNVEICVFTITDNSIADAILGAFRRGVRVRIITDDEKAWDRGSDVLDLREAGVPVRMDRSEDHMHHKFAVFDRRLLVTGSYNWTRSAARRNLENIAITDDRRLVGPFLEEFERLWQEFAPGERESPQGSPGQARQ